MLLNGLPVVFKLGSSRKGVSRATSQPDRQLLADGEVHRLPMSVAAVATSIHTL